MKSVAQVLYRRLRATSALVSFSPSSLFASGEQGVWLDNSDFTTLFQDASGTTPVTALEQPVGLRLDKSKGLVLGSELVTNGDFSSNTWWSTGGGAAISGGALNFTAAVATSGAYRLGFATVGKYYELTFEIISISSGGIQITLGTSSGTNRTAAGVYTQRILCTGNGNLTLYSVGASTTASVDNVSIKEVQGNHAFQTTNSARAVLSARYNLLTQTESFDNAVWTAVGAKNVSQIGSDWVVTDNSASVVQGIQNTGITVANGVTYKGTFKVKKTTGTPSNYPVYQIGLNNIDTSYSGVIIDTTNGTLVTLTGGVYSAPAASSIETSGDYWLVSLSVTMSSTATRVQIYPAASANGTTISAANTGSITIREPDLRPANESSALPAYQRVGAAVNGTSTSIGTPDYDTVGFPAYLRYDGGDWYQTNSIDFSTGATSPPLGPELVDTANNASAWTAYGTNTVEQDGDAVKITYVSEVNGAFLSLGAAGGLTSNLTANVIYRVTCQCKINTGSAQTQIVSAATSPQVAFSSTDYTDISFVFTADGSGESLRFIGMGVGEIVWIRNISVKAIDQLYYPDKMSVFAGVRKLSDAAFDVNVIAELSIDTGNSNGSFLLSGRNVYDSAYYDFVCKGTALSIAAETSSNFAAPNTAIVSALASISGDLATLRLNGLVEAQSTGDQGTGNFGNYSLYLGARAGTGFFFTGREYETIVLGRAVTATELTNTEGYMETQTFGKDMSYVYSDELTTATGDLITAADGDQIYMTVQYV